MIRSIAACLALATTALFGSIAHAQLSGEVGVASNAYFHGATVSDDNPALQGSLDYSHDTGPYAGTFMTTVDKVNKEEVEMDFYGGYKGNAGPMSYDVGIIRYQHTATDTLNTNEAYVGAGFRMVNTVFAINKDGRYTQVGANHDFYGVKLGAHFGNTMPEGGNNYTNWGITARKEYKGFAITGMLMDSNAPVIGDTSVAVKVSKMFEFF